MAIEWRSTKWERILYQFFLLDTHSMLILILRVIYLFKVWTFIFIFCVYRICINYNISSYISSVYKKYTRSPKRQKDKKLTWVKKVISSNFFFFSSRTNERLHCKGIIQGII